MLFILHDSEKKIYDRLKNHSVKSLRIKSQALLLSSFRN